MEGERVEGREEGIGRDCSITHSNFGCYSFPSGGQAICTTATTSNTCVHLDLFQ